MSSHSYDGSLELPRKLTDEEQRELRILLLPYFHASGGGEDLGPEDISDFLDYAFAMISNQKSVDYVMQELQGMEMDFCPPSVSEKVGRVLSEFLKAMQDQESGGGDDSENTKHPTAEKEGNNSSRVVSLKVRTYIVMDGFRDFVATVIV
jgi:hypothetical protein